jgi:hypothetical protein
MDQRPKIPRSITADAYSCPRELCPHIQCMAHRRHRPGRKRKQAPGSGPPPGSALMEGLQAGTIVANCSVYISACSSPPPQCGQSRLSKMGLCFSPKLSSQVMTRSCWSKISCLNHTRWESKSHIGRQITQRRSTLRFGNQPVPLPDGAAIFFVSSLRRRPVASSQGTPQGE